METKKKREKSGEREEREKREKEKGKRAKIRPLYELATVRKLQDLVESYVVVSRNPVFLPL